MSQKLLWQKTRHSRLCFYGHLLFILILLPLLTDRVYAQSAVTMDGQLSIVVADDFENKRSELLYFLEPLQTDKTSQKPDQNYRLRFNGNPPANLKPGDRIRVAGTLSGNELMVAPGLSIQSLASPKAKVAAAPIVVGPRKVLAILVNFNDKVLPCTAPNIQGLLFTDIDSISNLYWESSYHNLSLTGDVVGPYTIPYSSASGECTTNYYNWSNAANILALDAGINFNNYIHIVYFFPTPATCYARGLGEIGPNPPIYRTKSWIFECSDWSDWVVAHELGHNLGMYHAATLTYEYGDASDPTGIPNSLRQNNGPHKVKMGWVPPSRVYDVTCSGTYKIAQLETEVPDIQVLRISKPDTNEYYYASYRVPTGFDTTLGSEYVNRTNIHRWHEPNPYDPKHTYFLAGLGDTEVFNDPVNGITVTQLNHDSNHSTVSISLANNLNTCTASATTTQTLTATLTFTQTATPSVTATVTQTLTASLTFTQTATPSVTATITQTEMATPTSTYTETVTVTKTPVATATATATHKPLQPFLDKVVTYPNPLREDTLTFYFYSDTGDSGTIRIYTVNLQCVQNIDLLNVSRGENFVTWNGKDFRGMDCANGLYYYSITIKRNSLPYSAWGKLAILR